jgi:hypothetical protein
VHAAFRGAFSSRVTKPAAQASISAIYSITTLAAALSTTPAFSAG